MTRLFEESGLFVELTEEQAESVTGGVDLAALVRDAFYADPNPSADGSLSQPASARHQSTDSGACQGLNISSLPASDLQP